MYCFSFRLYGLTLTLLASLLLTNVGCVPVDEEAEPQAQHLPLEGITLKLLVADDPAMAKAIDRLRGEWKAQSGATLEVTQVEGTDWHSGEKLDADAAICPEALLGVLAESEKLAEIPASLANYRDPEWNDLFELLRVRTAKWGSQTMAVPFGSPVLTVYYRADLFKKMGLAPPKTWKEYHELAKKLADRDKVAENIQIDEAIWYGTVEPLAPGWAGLTLLAHAAAQAKHPDNYSTLFQIDTMRPLINSPPMILALSQVVDLIHPFAKEAITWTPADTRRLFWEGKTAMALTWPTGAETPLPSNTDGIEIGLVELPGSQAVYHIDEQRWIKRDKGAAIQVPLLGIAGRIGVISKGSSYPEGAAKLLLWLSGKGIHPPVASQSRATTLSRRSFLANLRPWVETAFSENAALCYGDQTAEVFQRQDSLFALRIPGRAAYLESLDQAVQQAVQQKGSPQAALSQAAREWQSITGRLGVEAQKKAYQKSLGLD